MKFFSCSNFPITACILGLAGLMSGCLEMKVSFESTNPDISRGKSAKPLVSQTVNSISVPHPNITENPIQKKNYLNFFADRFKSSDSGEKRRGILRMSNQTNEPVRLAFLARQTVVNNASINKTTRKDKYDIPAHWDFAPQEGSLKGLILSLPQGELNLEKGDILVAFAQDGSGRYWGPYVVGETPSPQWSAETKEWQLVLTP